MTTIEMKIPQEIIVENRKYKYSFHIEGKSHSIYTFGDRKDFEWNKKKKEGKLPKDFVTNMVESNNHILSSLGINPLKRSATIAIQIYYPDKWYEKNLIFIYDREYTYELVIKSWVN